jgi:putative tryptophan/tyrosine transport system substrate-binding protein
MDRRTFLCGLTLGTLSIPLAADAQPAGKLYRIGYLGHATPPVEASYLEAFRQQLRELGYAEGKNLAIEYRSAEAKLDRFQPLAADLVGLRVDVFVAASNPATIALKRATQSIPIVMVTSGDPVGTGLVASLARPGGNVTGFSNLAEGLSAKWVELLREAVPKVGRVAGRGSFLGH